VGELIPTDRSGGWPEGDRSPAIAPLPLLPSAFAQLVVVADRITESGLGAARGDLSLLLDPRR
jgi:hypothetical protein